MVSCGISSEGVAVPPTACLWPVLTCFLLGALEVKRVGLAAGLAVVSRGRFPGL